MIYCFADGRVAEKGTHSELLAKRGNYVSTPLHFFPFWSLLTIFAIQFELVQMQNLSRQ